MSDYRTDLRRNALKSWAEHYQPEVDALRQGKTYEPEPVLGSQALGSAWQAMGDGWQGLKVRMLDYADPVVGNTDGRDTAKMRDDALTEARQYARDAYDADRVGRPYAVPNVEPNAWVGMRNNGIYPGGWDK